MPGSDIRATPPSRRMSAGTRSSAITAHGAGVLGDHGLLGVDDVHDHAALEHLGEAALDAHRAGLGLAAVLAHAISVARCLERGACSRTGGSRRLAVDQAGGRRRVVVRVLGALGSAVERRRARRGCGSSRRSEPGAAGAAGRRSSRSSSAGPRVRREQPRAAAAAAASELLSVAALAAAAALPAAVFIDAPISAIDSPDGLHVRARRRRRLRIASTSPSQAQNVR